MMLPIGEIVENGVFAKMLGDSIVARRQQQAQAQIDQTINTLVAQRDAHYEKANVNAAASFGIAAQRDALITALRQLCPNHPLLKVNGKDNSGANTTPLSDIYDKAFDATIARTIGGNPKKFRTYRVR